MTDHTPFDDDLLSAVDALSAAMPNEDARQALGTLLRIVFDRVTSMAAVPTAVLGPRVDTIE
jgi:hypothetical protein